MSLYYIHPIYGKIKYLTINCQRIKTLATTLDFTSSWGAADVYAVWLRIILADRTLDVNHPEKLFHRLQVITGITVANFKQDLIAW